MKNLVEIMKQKVQASGSSKKEIIFFKEGTIKRVRFLQELDEGEMFQFHSDFNSKIYAPCQDPEDHENCPYCKDDVALKDEFVWSVYDYDSSEVKLFKTRVTSQSPAPQLIDYFEEYGTLKDRDYKIKKVGKGQNSSYVVTPLDKEKFKGKGKPYTRKEIEEIFDKAYNAEEEVPFDEDKKPSKKEKKVKEEPDVLEQLSELSWSQIKDIALELGMTKKEIKAFDKDVDDLASDLVDNYEEEDLLDMLDNMED